jgi:hypothetical protein
MIGAGGHIGLSDERALVQRLAKEEAVQLYFDAGGQRKRCGPARLRS